MIKPYYKGGMMTNWKPKNLEEALDDAIGSAINDFAYASTDSVACPEILHKNDFDNAIKQAVKNIKNIKGLKIKYKEE